MVAVDRMVSQLLSRPFREVKQGTLFELAVAWHAKIGAPMLDVHQGTL